MTRRTQVSRQRDPPGTSSRSRRAVRKPCIGTHGPTRLRSGAGRIAGAGRARVQAGRPPRLDPTISARISHVPRLAVVARRVQHSRA